MDRKKLILCIILCFVSVMNLIAQEDLVTVGINSELEFKTIKLQAISGDWNVNLYPLLPDSPRAREAQKIYRKVNFEKVSESLVPGEDISLLLVAKGIVARISSEKDVDKGFESAVFEGGDLISLEIPGETPMLLEGMVQVDINRDNLSIINIVKLENLVVSTVSLLGEPTSEIEALKALTVVARSKILHLMGTNPHKNALYDLCDKAHCLPFKGYGANRDLVEILAKKTQGKVLTYNEEIILPRYHNTCGGIISSAKEVYGVDNEPYHPRQIDILDGTGTENCYHSPNFHWSSEFKKPDFMDFIAVEYAAGIVGFYPRWEPSAISNDGRVTQILLRGRLPLFINGHNFLTDSHKHFGENGLKSMRFKLTEQLRSYLFQGMGKGTGVGLCLYGADGLAKKGLDAAAILQFYYPGTIVQDAPVW